VLIFHPGGFIFNSSATRGAGNAARRGGFEARIVDYPLADVPAAVNMSLRLAKRLHRHGRTVYAYGESAGGTLALLLAERGLVRAAAAQAPVSDIPGWIVSTGNDVNQLAQVLKLDQTQLTELSPDTHETRSPIMAETPVNDPISATTDSWAASRPLVKAVPVPGAHLDPAYRASNVTLAMRFLTQRRRADMAGRSLGTIRY